MDETEIDEEGGQVSADEKDVRRELTISEVQDLAGDAIGELIDKDLDDYQVQTVLLVAAAAVSVGSRQTIRAFMIKCRKTRLQVQQAERSLK